MALTHLEQRVTEIIQPSLEAMGYEIVQVRINEGAKRRILVIKADRADGKGMTIDDCTEISHTVSALLDVEDPISGAYQLEVSSPGIDRPLTRLADFTKYAGHEVKLESMMPIQGRKRWRGPITGVEGNDVLLSVDGVEHRIPMDNIRSAKLVLTNALIEAALKGQKTETHQTSDKR